MINKYPLIQYNTIQYCTSMFQITINIDKTKWRNGKGTNERVYTRSMVSFKRRETNYTKKFKSLAQNVSLVTKRCCTYYS